MSEVVFFGKFLEKSAEVIDDDPETDRLIVFFKVFPCSFVEIVIIGLRSLERTPVITQNFTVSDNGSVPLCFLDLKVVLHGIDVAVKMDRLKIRCTCDRL